MKFGEELRSSAIKEYQWYYIAYDQLKAKLEVSSAPSDGISNSRKTAWTEERESEFLDFMEAELEKVYNKQIIKSREIGRRIATAEREVQDITDRMGKSRGTADPDAPTEEEFMLLEEDLSEIIFELHDLNKFIQLNYKGFQKIVKKHDVGLLEPLLFSQVLTPS